MQIRTRPTESFDYTDNRMIDIECFPQQSVPIAVDMIMRRSLPSSWDDTQRRDGEDMMARTIMSIFQGCLNPTSKAIDRMYRLLDTTFNGAVYTATIDSSGQTIISPSIPDVPAPLSSRPIIPALEWAEARQDNEWNGTGHPGLPAKEGLHAEINRLIAAVEAGEPANNEDIIPILQAILAALA